jgi:hypothetical protein
LRLLTPLSENLESAYQEFVCRQPDSKKLDYPTFQELSKLLRFQSVNAQRALLASCFLTISDKAKALAKDAGATVSFDSEKFLTDTISTCPYIYPIWVELGPEVRRLLPFVFLKDTHARHMLYTEGGNNMFATLRAGISSGTLTPEMFEIWFGRWIINIAGFRGHEEPKGSAYLTQDTARCLLALKGELDKLWKNVEHDVLATYLDLRASWLKVDSPLLAHLGSLMRLQSPEEGLQLQKWYGELPRESREAHESSFQTLRALTKVTPTFEPAVLDNLMALGCSVGEAITIHSKIKMAASRAYCAGIANESINASVPLCFRSIAMKDNLLPILEEFRKSGRIEKNFQIHSNGDVFATEPISGSSESFGELKQTEEKQSK